MGSNVSALGPEQLALLASVFFSVGRDERDSPGPLKSVGTFPS